MTSTAKQDTTVGGKAGSSAPAGDSGGRSKRDRLPEWAQLSLQIFGLAGIAVAQPLFSLLGENPTYFVAHRARPLDLVVFALGVVLLPALAFIIPVLLVRLISRRAGTIAAALVIGLLGTLALLGAFHAVNSWRIPYFLAAVALGTGLVAWCYARFRVVRSFALNLGAAPVVFAGLFIFTSGVQPLVFGSDPEVLAVDDSQAPVIVLVFDELPLGALLTEDGRIDRDRFPGFAELADTSTWYPRATSVASYTFIAIPALLTGRLPDPALPPVAGQYPRSLFTLLGGSRELHVGEKVTSLCPRNLCATEDDPPARRGLARDTAIVALHQQLPASLADQWLPSISGSWTDFGEHLEQSPPPLPDDDIDLGFAEWGSRLRSGTSESVDSPDVFSSLSNDEPGLWYQHEMLPHMHYRFLPDGRTYQGTPPRSWNSDAWWVEDELATVNAQQRLLLQLEHTDTDVTALIDQLRDQDMLEDSLLVVMADHGIDFGPGRNTRGKDMDGDDEPTADGVLPVPLFVKYPGQTTGAVDQRDAQSVDVLPTIVDALGVDLPNDWQFDGRSLLADPPASQGAGRWVRATGVEELSVRPDAVRYARHMAELFGPFRGAHDIYAVGPYRDLVGRAVGSIGPEVADATIVSTDPDALKDVDVGGASLPALFTGDVTGLASGSWVALAIDDTVAGIGPVYRDHNGQAVVEIMIDPVLIKEGNNEWQLYLVSPDETTLRPVVSG